MSTIDDILAFNKKFVEEESYKRYETDKYPDKKLAIVSCMDTRLTELLPAALGLKNGDAKIIKNAGGVISHPFGSVIRSLLVAIYELGVTTIMVIGHSNCGAQHMNAKEMINHMIAAGISQDHIQKTVETIAHHPLIPPSVEVQGFIIDSKTGELTKIEKSVS